MPEIDIENCFMTHYPAGVLLRPAEEIAEVTDDIRRLAAKMIDIMLESSGVGLAGPQIGVPLRIFVFSIDATRENAKAYINPQITTSGGFEAYEEGCLSLPGINTKVRRHKECTITATDLEGNTFTEEAQGLQIRGFQHEYDHLQGVLIKDRMNQVQRIAHRKQLRQLQQDFENNK